MDAADARFARELDLRYTGQGYELRTPLDGLFTRPARPRIRSPRARERFDERHAQIHGHAAKERPVEVVSYRLRVRVPVPKYQPREEKPPPAPPSDRRGDQGHSAPSISTARPRSRPRSTSATGSTSAQHRRARHRRAVRRHHRHPAGWTARVDGLRNLILEKSGDLAARRVTSPMGAARDAARPAMARG